MAGGIPLVDSRGWTNGERCLYVCGMSGQANHCRAHHRRGRVGMDARALVVGAGGGGGLVEGSVMCGGGSD